MLRIQIPKEKLTGRQTPTTVLMKAGMHQKTAGKLLGGQPTRITTNSLTRLCIDLHCTPNELFVFEEDAEKPLAENHPLRALIRQNDVDITTVLHTLPQDAIEKIKDIIRQVNPEPGS